MQPISQVDSPQRNLVQAIKQLTMAVFNETALDTTQKLDVVVFLLTIAEQASIRNSVPTRSTREVAGFSSASHRLGISLFPARPNTR